MSLSNNFPAIAPSLNLDFANVKALDPRITFTRTTTATYYDGVTTSKAEENLLYPSENFTTSPWSSPGSTPTADTEVAPDGTTTADTVTADAGLSTHQLAIGFTSIAATYTFSVFAKAGTNDYIQLRFAAAVGAPYVNFDITSGAGAVGTNGGGGSPTGTITDVGNGWYRCSMTATLTAGAANPGIFLVTSSSAAGAETWTALGTETVILWGAQLEQRSAVSSYTPTTTQAITNYIPALQTAASGVARFDHNPTTGESLGLLVEEQRTNTITYSEDFTNAAWGKARTTVTSNTIVAPDGTLTGDKLVEDTQTGAHHINISSVSFTSGTSYTLSGHYKAAERTRVQLQLGNNGTPFPSDAAHRAIFDLSTGTLVSAGGSLTATSITPVGNGWYRCSITAAAQATATDTVFQAFLVSSGTTSTYTGDGYSGLYIWGAQLEAGAFPTSYIATTSASVTRNADVASMTGTNFSSWFRADEGTLYMDVNVGADITGITYWSFNDGTSNNSINLLNNVAGTSGPYLSVIVGNVGQANLTLGAPVANQREQLSAAYKVNDFASSRNGGAVGTDVSGTLPVVDRASIGMNAVSAGQPSATIRKLAYYPSRLTNAQLQALTS